MKRIKKHRFDRFLLILPPIDTKLAPKDNSSSGNVVHSNLCSLATVVNKNFPEMEIRVIDGEIAPKEVNLVLNKLDDKTLVGISCSIMNYKMAKKIGKQAKSNGSYVVVGGQYASLKGFSNLNVPSAVHDLILFNPSAYDVAIAGQGELSLIKVINVLYEGGNIGNRFSNIPNLCYWENGKLIETTKKLPNLKELPIPNRDFLKKYFPLYKKNQKKQMKKVKSDYPETLKITFWSSLGCPKSLSSVCNYCSVPYAGQFQQRDARSVWEEIEYIYEKYGSQVLIYDVCDDITGGSQEGPNLSLLEELCITKPAELHSRHRVYARPDGITNESVSLLSKLGVEEIFIGVESMDPAVLAKAGRAMNPVASKRAIQLLFKTDFILNIATIWGLRGETKKSVSITLKFLKKCSELCSLLYINTGYSIPYRGSLDWALLYNHPKVGKKYCSKEFRDNPILTHREGIYDFHKLFSPNISFKFLDDAMEQVCDFSPINISMHKTLGVSRFSEYSPYKGPLTYNDST